MINLLILILILNKSHLIIKKLLIDYIYVFKLININEEEL